MSVPKLRPLAVHSVHRTASPVATATTIMASNESNLTTLQLRDGVRVLPKKPESMMTSVIH